MNMQQDRYLILYVRRCIKNAVQSVDHLYLLLEVRYMAAVP